MTAIDKSDTAIIRRTVIKAGNFSDHQLRAHLVACARNRVKLQTTGSGRLFLDDCQRPMLMAWMDAQAEDVSKHHREGTKSGLDVYGEFIECHVGDYAMAYAQAILDIVTKSEHGMAFSLALLPFRKPEDLASYFGRR